MPLMLGLQGLPVELLYEIQLYALSSGFPYVNRHTFYAFQATSSVFRARYLLLLLDDSRLVQRRRDLGVYRRPREQFLKRALRFPICTIPVLEAMFRLPFCPSEDILRRQEVDLPRRLFRSMQPTRRKPKTREPIWTEYDAPLPFLRFLFNEPTPVPSQPSLRMAAIIEQNGKLVPHALRNVNVNTYEGYPLSRAVNSGFVPLVRFLLAHGADPSLRGHLAVLIAIQRRDLDMVKLLIEPTEDGPAPEVPPELHSKNPKKRRRSEDDSASDVSSEANSNNVNKRRRVEDRFKPNAEMMQVAVKANARDIADYLLLRGGIPDMKTLQMMGT